MPKTMTSLRDFVTQLTFLVSLFHLTNAQAPRFGHTATIINDKLWVYGGKTGLDAAASTIAEMLTLNLAQPFNASSPPWNTVPQQGGPNVTFHVAFPNNNGQLVVFGGVSKQNTPNSVFIYDTGSRVWSQPSEAASLARRYEHTAATSPSGQTTFVFGGVTDEATAAIPTQFDELIQFNDGNQLTKLQASNPPTKRFHHSATMLSNGQMVIIGGFDGTMIDMSDIWFYDPATNAWQLKKATNTTGPLPVPRRDHVACATPDDKIIVFGGTNLTFNEFFKAILVLDTKTMTWSQPTVTGRAPTGRYSHTCTSVGQLIIFTFGFTQSGSDNSVSILDTSNFSWVQSFKPLSANAPAPSSPSTTQPESPASTVRNTITQTSTQTPFGSSNLGAPSTTLMFIGIALGVTVALAAIVVVAFVFYRRRSRGVPYHLASLDSVRSQPSKIQQNWSALSSSASPPPSKHGSLQNIAFQRQSSQSLYKPSASVPDLPMPTTVPMSQRQSSSSSSTATSRPTVTSRIPSAPVSPTHPPVRTSKSPSVSPTTPTAPTFPSTATSTSDAIANARSKLPTFPIPSQPSRYDSITRYEPATTLDRNPSTASQWTDYSYSRYTSDSRRPSISESVLSSTTGGISHLGSVSRQGRYAGSGKNNASKNNGWDSDNESEVSQSNNGWGRGYTPDKLESGYRL